VILFVVVPILSGLLLAWLVWPIVKAAPDACDEESEAADYPEGTSTTPERGKQ
jgi:hypothetical protein